MMRPLGFAAVLLMGTLAAVPAAVFAQLPVFSARVDAVRVDVLVQADRRPVPGLQASDFIVIDNGVPQTVDLVMTDQLSLNVVQALDLSGSVTGSRLSQLRAAGRALMGGLRTDDKAALITFGRAISLRAPLTADLARVENALNESAASGDTALIDACHAALVVGQSEVGRALVIVFSDGLDTISWLEPDAVINTARRSNAVVYGVSASTADRPGFLARLSAETGGRLIDIESTKAIDQTFLAILEEFRHRYVISYTPRGVPKGGWHTLGVRTTNRRATVQARSGYYGGS